LGLKIAIFQILKTVQGQDQDRFSQDQDQDLKKMVLRPRPVLRTTSLVLLTHSRSFVVTHYQGRI